MSLKAKLTTKSIEALAPNPDKRNNKGPYLYKIWIWQTILGIAKKELEKAWEAAQNDEIILPDEDLRAKYEGDDETIVADSDYFSCSVKCAAASQRFDLEMFLVIVSKKFKIPMPKLIPLIEISKKPATPALSKKVLESIG